MTLNRFRFYRRFKGGIWYLHIFTEEASWICSSWVGEIFWARYDALNRYSKVIHIENYNIDNLETNKRNG